MCLHGCYTSNMTARDYPCNDCPGLPHGCHFDEQRMVCKSHAVQRRQMHQKFTTKPTGMTEEQRIKNVLRACEGLTAPAAYNCVELFSGPNEVIWPLKGNRMREIVLKKFVEDDSVNWCMATNVRFKFWGGPPKKLDYYNGSLETLLKDRVLSHIATYGVKEAERMLQLEIEEPKERQLCLPF